MNFNKFINSDYLKEKPLCGISTYKDELNLATGACTRKIKELVLTGQETFVKDPSGSQNYSYYYTISESIKAAIEEVKCTHLNYYSSGYPTGNNKGCCIKTFAGTLRALFFNFGSEIMDAQTSGNTKEGLKEYLAAQYTNGTPVTVYYVLATPTTETITVPSGLSGTEEGYLVQDSTPTPTNPIYPTANTVEKWFDINHYIMGTDTDTLTTLPADIYANDTTATVGLKGDMVQNGTPSPTTPIQPQECGDLETTGEHAGQYKIPILNNSQTTNVYLGEVQSTRRIKKLVLTGEESGTWSQNPTVTTGNAFYNEQSTLFPNYSPNKSGYCTHYATTASATVTEGIYWGNNINFITDINDNIDTPAKWKQYLAAQYANGTPVTVWYVLATPETAVVNEPLRKIGDYADTVSGITIPTITGADSFDVLTTLKPSEVSLAYTGWHDASVKEWDGSEWQ